MKLSYPRFTNYLLERGKNSPVLLVACVDNVPIGYISSSSIQTTSNVWIKDLVVLSGGADRGGDISDQSHDGMG
jgi:hypothetical protein